MQIRKHGIHEEVLNELVVLALWASWVTPLRVDENKASKKYEGLCLGVCLLGASEKLNDLRMCVRLYRENASSALASCLRSNARVKTWSFLSWSK